MFNRASAGLLTVTLLATLFVGQVHALVFRPTELSTCPVTSGGEVSCIGAEITVGFRAETIPGDFVLALNASAYGWDEDLVEFVTGQTVAGLFYWDPTGCSNCDQELDNSLLPQSPNGGRSPASGPLSGSESGQLGGRVVFFSGTTPSSSAATQSAPGGDYDLGGFFNRTGSQFRITFRLLGAGTSIIRIGADHPGDGVLFIDDVERKLRPAPGFSLVLSSDAQPYVIPEPTTAMLMGFGLMLLSARRARCDERLRDPFRRRRPSGSRCARSHPCAARRSPG